MKVLFVQGSVYVPTHNGASKANHAVLQGLAERHECQVVAPMCDVAQPVSVDEFVPELKVRGYAPTTVNDQLVAFDDGPVPVELVASHSRLREVAAERARRLRPDVVIVASDDAGRMMARTMLDTTTALGSGQVIYLAYLVPTEPQAIDSKPLRGIGRVFIQSQAAADNLATWLQRPVEVLRIPIYPQAPKRFDSWRHPYVTMINPCDVKGIDILLGLADARPEVPFLAVKGWGFWSDDEAAIRSRPNIRLIDPVDDVDEIYKLTRVLLVPSLYFEVFGQVTVEAMQHGIPVLASDWAGLREAKLGVPYLLPVTPITSYLPASGELWMQPVVPPQDIGPWLRTLDRVLSDVEHYRGLAEASATAAAEFVAGCSLEPLQRAIEELAGRHRARLDGADGTAYGRLSAPASNPL